MKTVGWWLDGIIYSMDMSLSKLREITVKDREARHAAVHAVTIRHYWATEEQLSTYKIGQFQLIINM